MHKHTAFKSSQGCCPKCIYMGERLTLIKGDLLLHSHPSPKNWELNRRLHTCCCASTSQGVINHISSGSPDHLGGLGWGERKKVPQI